MTDRHDAPAPAVDPGATESTTATPTADGRVADFCAAATGARAEVVRVPDADAARAALAELVERVGARHVAADDVVPLRDLELPRTDDPWSAEMGIAVALAAAADTGTVVLGSGPGRARATLITPPYLAVWLDAATIGPSYDEVLIRLAARGALPSAVRCITGPTRSSDIELKTVYGLHGPEQVTIVVVG